MHVDEQESERAGLEGRHVGAAVEPLESLGDARQLDVTQLARRHRQPTDLLERPHLGRVVEKRLALTVPRGVRDERPVRRRQERVDRPEATQVVRDFLDRNHVEPADHFRDQPVILLATLLDAEVGDVPGSDQQPIGLPGGHRAAWLGLLVLT